MSIRLKKFVMASIPQDSVVLFIGKRQTGKSFLVRDLLYHHKSLPIGTVISGTEGANAFYSKLIPSIFIHNEIEPQTLKNVLSRQKLVLKTIKNQFEQWGSTNTDPRAFLILDDCLYDKSWVKDKTIRCMFMNGRHYKLLFIITMQYALGIPPNLRTNVDYVFILRENIFANRKRLYESYAGMFPSLDMFNQVMDQCTENYECLVLHNNSKSNKLEDQVFWYKANMCPEFKIGAPQFWQYHADKFNNNYDNDEDNTIYKNRSKSRPQITVKKSY
tara:strand:- start:1017 stop:1838 length:822 start_codon:yes stop_codon:yes gene_type:complete